MIATKVRPTCTRRYNPNYTLDNETGLYTWLKIDDGAGATLDDTSSNNNDMSLFNSPTWATLPSGKKVLELNGSSQYGTISTKLTNLDTTGFSLCAWVKPTIDASSMILLRSRDINAIQVRFGTTPDFNMSIVDTVNGAKTPSTNITNDVWLFVSARYDIANDEGSVSLNAGTPVVESGITNLSQPLDSEEWFYNANTASSYLDGQVGMIACWERTITDTEIANLYAATKNAYN